MDYGYKLKEDGFVEGVYLDSLNLHDALITDEPFDINTYTYWKKDLETDEWIDLRTLYKYIIMPCEMIDSLLPLVDEVEDVELPQFSILLDCTDIITRAGNDVAIQDKTVRFFICKLLQWDEGDKEQIEGLITIWNEANPTRIIDFECCFEDSYELEAFVNENSISEW